MILVIISSILVLLAFIVMINVNAVKKEQAICAWIFCCGLLIGVSIFASINTFANRHPVTKAEIESLLGEEINAENLALAEEYNKDESKLNNYWVCFKLHQEDLIDIDYYVNNT